MCIYLFMPEFDHPEVTWYGGQGIKIQYLPGLPEILRNQKLHLHDVTLNWYQIAVEWRISQNKNNNKNAVIQIALVIQIAYERWWLFAIELGFTFNWCKKKKIKS